MDNTAFIILFFIYLILLFIFVKKSFIGKHDLTEYSVAGRSSGTLVFSFSFAARWFVGSIFTVWFFMSVERGLYAQYLLIYTICAVLIFRTFGVPIYNLGKKYNLETQADFIYLRYGNRAFQGIFAGVTLLFWLPWITLELKTIGIAVSAASYGSIEYNIGIILITMIIIIVCYYGGVRGVNNASILQAGVVFILGIICPYYLINKLFGGIGGIISGADADILDKFILDISSGQSLDWLSAILSGSLGSIVWPGMYALIFTAKSTKVIKRSSSYSLFLLIPPIFFILLLGMGLNIASGDELSDLSNIFAIAQKHGGHIILSLIGVTAIAASMTMCAAVFNVGGIIIAKDLNPHYNEKKRDKAYYVAKVGTVAIGLLALWIATIQIPNLSTIVFLMYSFIIQVSGPLMLGIFWRRSTVSGAASGLGAGIIITAVISFNPEIITLVNGISAGIIGLLANIFIHVIVSLLTKPYEKVDEIFAHRY